MSDKIDHTIVLYDSDKSRADLVAEAIALCEIVEAVLTEKVNNPLLYITDKPHIDEIVRVNAQNSQDATNLRFVKAHLAEFEEHEIVSVLGVGATCTCGATYFYYPEVPTVCHKATTKAQRLLGVSE